MIIKQDYGTLTGGELEVESIITDVQKSLTAGKNYATGKTFIYDGKMYKATSDIAAGSAIVLSGSGANATPAGTVGDIITNVEDIIAQVPNDTINKIQSNGLTKLALNFAYSDNDLNIDKVHGPYGYIYRFANYNSSQGTYPSGLGGNAIMLIGFSSIAKSGLPAYGVQIAFGFGSDKIAIRHVSYNVSGAAWGAWKYLTAS